MRARQQELIELERRLAVLGIKLDLKTLHAEYSVPGYERGQDLTVFLRWLQIKGHISEALAEELMAELAVEVTGLNVLEPYYDRTRTIDLKHGDLIGMTGQMPSRQGSAYQLLKQVGAGAMGSVHLAKDRLLRRTVAFKQLLEIDGKTPDSGVSLRFLGEAQITSQLDHPHVIPIYGLETREDGQVAYTMKMIQGLSLKQWIAKARAAYDLRRQDTDAKISSEYRLGGRLRLFLKICDAMAFAHSKGVIHRDLKPANVMLGRYGEVYVMDWGIARPFMFEAEGVEIESMDLYAHEKGQIVGTPRYMSPEQAAGLNDNLDQRSDLFALGLILYEMVSFRQAIQGKDMTDTLHRVIKGQLEPLNHLYDETIPPGLAAIIHHATARNRKDRYREVGDLAADLRRFLNEERVLAHKETSVQSLLRAVNRHRQKVLPALLGLLLLGGGLTLGVELLRQRQQAIAEAQRVSTAKLLSDLANHGQQLGGRFQLYENILQELTSAARIALLEGRPAPDKVYFADDFVVGKAPPDWQLSPVRKESLSFGSPVFTAAPDVQISAQLPARLLPLRHLLYNLFSQSRGPDFAALPRARQHQELMTKPGILLNASVDLSQGLQLAYPGRRGIATGTDMRKRTMYRLGANIPNAQVRWLESHHDAILSDHILPGVQALRDADGKLLGVVSIDLSLNEVAKNWLEMKQRPELTDIWLRDAKGQSITGLGVKAQTEHWEDESTGVSGSGFKVDQSGRYYYAWTTLERQGWTLVIRGELDGLYNQP